MYINVTTLQLQQDFYEGSDSKIMILKAIHSR